MSAVQAPTIRLNLGSGELPLAGYVNIDRKTGREAYPLPYLPDGSVSEVRAAHVLEHFGFLEVPSVLREWVRVLQVGGWLRIAVPDLDWIVRKMVGSDYPVVPADTPTEALVSIQSVDEDGVTVPVENYLFGGQQDADDFHKIAFNEWKLSALMRSVGLVGIRRWTSETNDCASYAVSLNLEGWKA